MDKLSHEGESWFWILYLANFFISFDFSCVKSIDQIFILVLFQEIRGKHGLEFEAI